MRNVLLSWRYSLPKGNFYDSHHDSILYSGKKSIIFQVLAFLLSFMLGYIQLNSLEAKTFSFVVPKTSELPIHAIENSTATANIIAIIGGKGLKNSFGNSRNYLANQKQTFAAGGLNFYLLPNYLESEKASYRLRASKTRANRILALVKALKTRNGKPVFIIGFSRGSVDTGRFAKTYPGQISGIVLASGIYTNESKKAELYSMEMIIGDKIDTATLIVHHSDDSCHVTLFSYAESFYQTLTAPSKDLFVYSGGEASGRACGPLNHHGFEGIEEKVARDITKWITRIGQNK